ncbi:hypothetical protein HR51_09140 [Burkholderia cepacia]|nr:hypothetical protein HR51_09140 [Burkholderia cepacia]
MHAAAAMTDHSTVDEADLFAEPRASASAAPSRTWIAACVPDNLTGTAGATEDGRMARTDPGSRQVVRKCK